MIQLTQNTNPTDEKSIKKAGTPLFPRYYVYWMQVTGIFPCSANWLLYSQAEHQRVSFSKCLLLLTGFWFLLCLLDGMVQMHDLSIVYGERLHKMEFFTLISFVYHLNLWMQGPLSLICMIIQSRRIPYFFSKTQSLLREVCKLKPDQIPSAEKVFYASVVWNACCMAGTVAVLFAVDDLLLRKAHFNWTTSRTAVFKLVMVPPYADHMVHGIFMAVGMSYQMIPQFLAVVTALCVSSGFRQVGRILGQNNLTLGDLQDAMRKYRKFQCTTNEMNGIFSRIVLLNCLGDVITWVALIAAAMPRMPVDVTNVDPTVMYDPALRWNIIGNALIGLCNTVLRLIACIVCHEQAQSIRDFVVEIASNTNSKEVETECEKMCSQMRTSDGAVSAFGFFNVTKEYVTTFVGLLFTYFLLIYQTRDSKMDLRELASKVELSQVQGQIATVVTALTNLTAF